MKSNKFIISVFIVLVSWSAGAQGLGFDSKNLTVSSNRLQGKMAGKIFYITALANGKFLYPNDWVEGEVVLSDDDKFDNIKLRYHAKDDEVIVYNDKRSSLFIVEKAQVKSFLLKIDGVEKKFLKLSLKGEKNNGQYFEELFSGDQQLLGRRYVYERKVNPYVDGSGMMRDIEYEMKTEYFRYSEKEGYNKMSIKRKAFLKAFPEHKKEIKKLFRSNSIVFNSEQAIVRAFTILNENGLLK